MTRTGRVSYGIYGLLGGTIGAASMTPLRLLGRRRGLIDKTVPQAVEEWMAARVEVDLAPPARRRPELHHAADHLLHLGYGATLGALYGLLRGGRKLPVGPAGLVYGAATWFVGTWLVLPRLGVLRAPWRGTVAENAVNLAAHLLFGVTTALVADDLGAQPAHGPTSDSHRRRRSVG